MMAIRRDSRRGSILLISLFFVAMASVAAIGALGYVGSMHRMDERIIAREKALSAAEAGVYRLLSYFNQSTTIPSSCATNRALIESYFDGMDPSAIVASGMTFINAASNLNPDLIALDRAKVARLTVSGPRTNAVAGTAFTFTSVASCSLPFAGTVERTVLMDVAFDMASRLIVPAGLVSGGAIASHGHFNLHWGEAWTKGTLALDFSYKSVRDHPEQWDYTGGNNQVNAGSDSWVGYRTTDYIMDKDGTKLVNDAAVNDVGARNVNLDPKYLTILYQQCD
ncbi:MAG: hypothetical protein NTW86_33080, partial [Candidatus Sumerlaeota bacterium]|nr:hypothetical protein [Candidatus Sumerlaeota bacterium]